MKNSITQLIFLLFILPICGTAQTPSWNWAASAGDAGNDNLTSMVADPSGDGSIYVTGLFAGPSITFGTFTLTGTDDIFVVKYDASGTVLWAKSIGQAGIEQVHAITADASGGIYITGAFASDTIYFGPDTLLCGPRNTLLVAKYDNNGNEIFARNSAGGVGYAMSLDLSGSGAFYVAGTFTDTLIFGNDTIGIPWFYLSDIYILKYDASGNPLWARSAGGEHVDLPLGLCTDQLGNCYITGAFYSDTMRFSSTNYILNSGGYDVYVAKYNSGGDFSWSQQAIGTNADQALAMIADPLVPGNFYISGFFHSDTLKIGSTSLINANTIPYADIFVAKFDSSGLPIWARNAGRGLDESAMTMAMDFNGDLFVGGYFTFTPFTFGISTLTNSSPSYLPELLILKYDANGTPLWAMDADGGDDDRVTALAPNSLSPGGFYVAGNYLSPTLDFGVTALTNNFFSNDIFVAKADFNVGIANIKSGSDLYYMYPNPSHGVFRLVSNNLKTDIDLLEIYSGFGEIVYSKENFDYRQEIDLSKFSKGMYFVKISSKGESSIGKIVVE